VTLLARNPGRRTIIGRGMDNRGVKNLALASARSLLFVPGDRPERFDKAAASGADVVLCDLEDAVAPENKAEARAQVAGWASGHPAAVRINAVDTSWHEDDLAAVSTAAGVVAVVLPKADTVEAITATAGRLPAGLPLYALIETARGVRDVDRLAEKLAETPGAHRLLFGNLDFGLDAGITPMGHDERELLYARSKLVIASRAAGLPAPIDGVCTDIKDAAETSALIQSATAARALGFGGKLCVHPNQVAAVNGAFSPAEEELRWARRVLEAIGDSSGAAVRIDGEMIDKPRVELARRLLDTRTTKT
jgi:citrate lyase beta subunit